MRFWERVVRCAESSSALVIHQQTREEAKEGFQGKQDTERKTDRQTNTQRNRKVCHGSANNTGCIHVIPLGSSIFNIIKNF
jgi:hypothetical protein